jgi:hypothetical protein
MVEVVGAVENGDTCSGGLVHRRRVDSGAGVRNPLGCKGGRGSGMTGKTGTDELLPMMRSVDGFNPASETEVMKVSTAGVNPAKALAAPFLHSRVWRR